MRSLTRTAVVMLALAVTAGSASAQVTVGTPGAGQGGTFPFGQGAGYTKFQEFLSASYFTGPLNINAVTFYRSANSTGAFQQGTFSLYLNSTTTTLNNYNFSNPSANEVAANRMLIGSVIIPDATTTAPTLTFTGGGSYNYDPSLGNLLIDVDFTPIGSLFAFGRATFDTFSDQIDGNQSNLVATASDPQAFFGGTASARGSGLVATFDVAATVVPEPSSVLLMAAGLAGLFVAARRKQTA